MAADNEKIFSLLLQVGLAGKEDIAALKDLMGEAGTSTKDLAAQMGVINVSSEDAAKILGKVGEKTELTHLSMRRLAHAMGSEIPGGAALMEAGFEAGAEPMLASIFLLTAGVEMLRSALDHLDKEKEQATKISDALADADSAHIKTIESEKEALEHAEVSQAEFYHNYLRNTRDAIDAAEKLAAAVLKTAVQTGDETANRRKGIAENEIEDMEKRGVLSHAAALKMKEQLDIAYEQEKLVRMKAQDELEVRLLASQSDSKQYQLHILQGTEKNADGAYETAAQNKAANDARIEAAKNKITAGEDTTKALRDTGVTPENIQQLNELYEKLTGKSSANASLEDQFHDLAKFNIYGAAAGVGDLGFADAFKAMFLIKTFGSQGDVNLATYEGAQEDITGGKKELGIYQGKQAGLDIAEGNAKSDLDFVRSQMQQARDQVQSLQDQITSLKATNAIKEGGAQQDLGLQQANSALVSDRSTADTLAAGGNVSGADQQKLMADAAKIAGHAVDLKTAVQIIENGANNLDIFMNQVGRLASALTKMSPNDLTNLQHQIDLLKAQMENGGYAASR
jgi:hypothetical protein